MPIADFFLPLTTPLRLLARAHALLNGLLPGHCALCGETVDIAAEPARLPCLCSYCDARFFTGQSHRCPVCARTLKDTTPGVRCGPCQTTPPAFDATIVACDYVAPADHLVQNLKFHAQLAMAPLFAQLLLRALPSRDALAADFITGVPLSRNRLSARGFNQAIEIARPLAKQLNLPLLPQLCTRVRDTEAQASLPLPQRRVNMRGAFIVTPGAPTLTHKTVIVVDDVITTGHTLHELAACLKRYGATRVVNLVLARTQAH
jgi:ComF family protein